MRISVVQEFQKKMEEKNRVLESARELIEARDNIIDLLRKEIFPFKGNVFKTKEKESEENKLEKIKDDYKKFFKYIEVESIGINYDLFKENFEFKAPTVLEKKICEAKDKKKNDELVALIKIRWNNLRDEIEKMSKKEIENEKPDKILKIAKEILKFNKQKQLG